MIVSDVVHESPQFATLVDQSKEIYFSFVAGETTSESIETSDIHFVMDKINWNLTKGSLNCTQGQRPINYGLMIRRR